MARVTAFNAERMLEIEKSAIIGGAVLLDDLILTRRDGATINAGNVRGPQGVQGPSGVITSVTASPVAAGSAPTVTLGGTPAARTIDLGVPTGLTGPAGTITSMTATSLPTGSAPTVTLGGTASARTVALGIPDGAQGVQGPSGTITSVTVSALAAGATPTITLGGTASARTIALGIPKGDTGATGSMVAIQEQGANVDLNTLITTGIYSQAQNAEASLALNYPVALAGLLEVYNIGSIYWQTYTPYTTNAQSFYKRSWFNSAWSPWYRYYASAMDPTQSHAWSFNGGNGQALPNATDVAYVPTIFNLLSGVTRSAGKVTITQDGYYQVDGSIRLTAGGSGGERYLAVMHQRGTPIIARASQNVYPGTGPIASSVSRMFRAVAGDVFYVNLFQNSGAQLNVDEIFADANFSGHYVRPL